MSHRPTEADLDALALKIGMQLATSDHDREDWANLIREWSDSALDEIWPGLSTVERQEMRQRVRADALELADNLRLRNPLQRCGHA